MPEAGKKYVYGLYLDKNSYHVDGLYETDFANELNASEFFIREYELTADDIQKAKIELLSVQPA